MVAAAAAVVVALSPARVHFGDLVRATVRGAGQPSFAPFVVRAHHGNEYVLQCLDPACVPGPGGRSVKLGRARVRILPRASEAQVARPLRSFRRETRRLPTSFRIAPGLLLALLLAGAVVLLGAAAVLAAPFGRRLVPERRDERTPLARAVDLVRASARREPEDRRRALDLLGRALGRAAPARDAFALAWSEPAPDPARIESLLEQVERPS